MKGGYFLRNGRFYKEDESVFTLTEFKKGGEGFCESFRAEHNEVLFPESIAAHLVATAFTIGIDLVGIIDPDGRLLRKDVSRLLNKNKLYLAARIEVQIYPADDQINLILNAKEIERGFYPVKEPGLIVSFYNDLLQPIQVTSAYATMGKFVRRSAGRMAEELNQPNMIILNSQGNCCESINGSFAFLNNDLLIFPAAGSGGYRCAILKKIIQSAKDAGFHVGERDNINPEELLQAEELFLFDSCNGIQKVLGLEDRRYFSPKTKIIAGKFSELARKDREEKV
jgi:branched-subunit amino acid aminotransferase/4-amino-4-deoxychorismate lyase